MAEIIQIAEPNPDMVEMLSHALECVKRGELTSLALVGTFTDGNGYHGIAGEVDSAALGEIDLLRADVSDFIRYERGES